MAGIKIQWLTWNLCCFLLAVMISCTEAPHTTESKVKYVIPDSLLKLVKIDTVKRHPLTNAIRLTGMVDFNQDKQINVFSLVSGNIQGIKVQLGDYVKKGEVLAVVNSSEMAGYSNNLVIAQSNLTATKKQLNAATELFKSGLASNLDVTNAQVAYDQAVAQLEMAKRILKINGDNTEGNYVITAPLNGYIVQKNVTNNTMVRSDNGSALFTISDLKDVWVQANVYEASVEQVHLGDPAEVRILSAPDKVFLGKVDKILNVLDPTSKVIKVRITLQNPDNILKPAMFASVVVTNPAGGDALCVPSKSLVYDRSRYYVLKYMGKGNVDITPVEVINTLGDNTFIRSGVQPGDCIVSTMVLQFYSELNN